MKPKKCWGCGGTKFRIYHNIYGWLIHECKGALCWHSCGKRFCSKKELVRCRHRWGQAPSNFCVSQYFIPVNTVPYNDTTQYLYDGDFEGGDLYNIEGEKVSQEELSVISDKEYEEVKIKYRKRKLSREIKKAFKNFHGIMVYKE